MNSFLFFSFPFKFNVLFFLSFVFGLLFNSFITYYPSSSLFWMLNREMKTKMSRTMKISYYRRFFKINSIVFIACSVNHMNHWQLPLISPRSVTLAFVWHILFLFILMTSWRQGFINRFEFINKHISTCHQINISIPTELCLMAMKSGTCCMIISWCAN